MRSASLSAPHCSTKSSSAVVSFWTTGRDRVAQMIRVVSGAFGGRKLQVPEGLATRPTTDKVRQAVFNSLDSAGLIDGAAVADLFAGSGALGIEALSRGAATCVFVERDRAALQALRANIAALALGSRTTVVTSDVVAWVPAMRGIDLALVDPPYEFDGWKQLLALLQVPYVVAESGHEVEPPPGWATVRSRRYGRTWVTQLERVA
jgi:16S rRNA (guanine966-N2)-methyltransferase